MGWLDPRLGECWSDIYIVPFYSWVIYALQSPTKKDSILLVICLCRIYAVFMVVYYWSAFIITLCRMTYLLPGCFYLFYFFSPQMMYSCTLLCGRPQTSLTGSVSLWEASTANYFHCWFICRQQVFTSDRYASHPNSLRKYRCLTVLIHSFNIDTDYKSILTTALNVTFCHNPNRPCQKWCFLH